MRTAEVIAAHLHEGRRFRDKNEVGAYAGLVPRQYQSGVCDRRGRITERGPSLLRSALVECAWRSLRYNRWAAATYRQFLANGLSKKKAIVALARKLLIRCWGILKSGVAWTTKGVRRRRESRTDPGHCETLVERVIGNSDDVVLTKAGPGFVCDPGRRPLAVTANSRVNPDAQSDEPEKTPRDTCPGAAS